MKNNQEINVGNLLKEANKLKRSGNLDEAIALYRQIIEINPRFAWAYQNLGEALSKQGNLDQAVNYYSQGLQFNPNSPWLLYGLGDSLGQQGDLEPAIEYLQKAIDIKPDCDKFHYRLSQVLEQKDSQGKTLKELYSEHKGKVSDKWSLYLSVYEQVLRNYRNTNINLLEIGVQNGGSLEIWAKYFPYAELIVGCDINPKCRELTYSNPKINVLIGDANSDDIQNNVSKLSKNFDIIIDDGSHYSSDVIKSFSRYFSLLKYGGIYIIEDLHTSYWQECQGGLFHPFSSINFLKIFIDIINYEHSGINKKQTNLLNEFYEKYNLNIDPIVFTSIHSITFFNSLCVISKCKPEYNNLGKRCIAGLIDKIVEVDKIVGYTHEVFENKKNNQWADINKYKINITIISCSQDDSEALWGFNLEDVEQINTRKTVQIMLKGWVLGKKSKVEFIEIIHNNTLTKKVLLNFPRRDVAQTYSHVHYAEMSGFQTIVNIGELLHKGELIIEAIFSDGSRILLSKIQFELLIINEIF